MHIIIGIAAGALIGFALGSLRTCTTGGCPLTSNPFAGAAFGALIGLLMALGK